MTASNRYKGREDHLRRLDPRFYRGHAWVHWTLSMQHRSTGWLSPEFYYKFRELLTHTMFRYSIVCPVYCVMPDHLHMIWLGTHAGSDQLNAMKYFRKQLKRPLDLLGHQLHYQSYDHVLRDDERLETAFVNLAEYIMRNPERKGLVPHDGYSEYKYTGNLLPGYPEVTLREPQYWEKFWKLYSFLRKNGAFRSFDEDLTT